MHMVACLRGVAKVLQGTDDALFGGLSIGKGGDARFLVPAGSKQGMHQAGIIVGMDIFPSVSVRIMRYVDEQRPVGLGGDGKGIQP